MAHIKRRPMKIPLNRQAKQPIYLQIRDRIGHLIQTGHLPPDAQLPSIRVLAQTVKVNKLTVLEAYSVLEADGLVRAKQGSGFFINPPGYRATAPKVISPESRPVERSRQFNPAQEVIIPTHGINAFPKIYAASLHTHAQDNYIDFGLGFPQPSGLEDLQRIARRAMKEAHTFFHPGDPQGDLGLRQQITQLLIQQGLEISPENLIVTSGSMQSLSLLVEHFVAPGDRVMVEAPTYHGFLSSLQQRNAQIVGIPMTLTAFFDTSDHVIYVGTFSKTLMPGLRVGYMAITGAESQSIIERKLLHDFHVSTASQAIIKEYLSSGHYRRRLNQLRSLHRERRDHMIAALLRHFPANVTWTVPNGGTFLWIQLPDSLCVMAVCAAAAAQKVLVGSGAAFFPTHQGYPALRLNFSLPPAVTERGIQILSDILKG